MALKPSFAQQFEQRIQPSCIIQEGVDEVDPHSGFGGMFSSGKQPTGQAQSSGPVNNMASQIFSSLLSGLDASYLSISPMLALSDNFEPRPDDDGAVDLQLDGSFQYRQQEGLDSDFQECLSTDQCGSFDQMNSNWNEIDNVQEFLKYTAAGLEAGIEDDLFIHPKSGTCADPTLAELNTKSIFDDLQVLDDLPLAEECSQFKFPTVPTTPQDSQDALVLPSVTGCSNLQPVPVGQTQFFPLVKQEIIQPPQRSTLHDLLLQNTNPVKNNSTDDSSSISAAAVVVVKEEPPLHKSTACSVPNFSVSNYLAEVVPCSKPRPRSSTISSCSSACDSQAGNSLDISQGYDNETRHDLKSDKHESDSNDDYSDTDDDSNQSNEHSDDDTIYEVNRPRTRHYMTQESKPKRRNKRGRYFWQYNLQAKGPKGNRLPLATDWTNPHKLEQVTDPVFSPRCIIKGIKHTGKARKGDGNDLTPNPEKLHQIGLSLKNLNQIINDLTPVNELPVNVRPKSRKEKNKLASRVCRLKKKAQHEANKLKLYGLQQEHVHLMQILKEMKKCFKEEGPKNPRGLLNRCNEIEKQLFRVRVAGRSVDFVNEVLDKVATGVPSGGLSDL